jgi:hypothetical protein
VTGAGRARISSSGSPTFRRQTPGAPGEDQIQVEALAAWEPLPRLVGERKLCTAADAVAIALARVSGLRIATAKHPTGSLSRPSIPDVCGASGMVQCMSLIDLIPAKDL